MPRAPRKPQLAEDMLRIGATMGLPQVLRDLGFDPGEVLAAGGFSEQLFDDPDNLISYRARNRLILHCARTAKCEHFGLLVGQQDGLHSLGLVGMLVRFSPDVRTALTNLVRFFHLRVRGARMSLQIQGGTAVLAYEIEHSGTVSNKQVSDGAIAGTFNILRELCGPDWQPIEVWARHSEPENTSPYSQFFAARMQFNAEQNAIVFHSPWLERALPEADVEVQRMLQKQLDSLAHQYPDDFPVQVRTVLRAALLSGDASADRVAALFSIHSRTLHRHLAVFGLGYQQLLDETRFDMARQMLLDTAQPISEIALMLQYADARSFIQAFRRWANITPARWRADQKRAEISQLASRR